MQLAASVAASAGGVTQLRECAAELVRFAKSSGTAVIIIGHVTKEGAIAGPRVLEHLVDTVLYFESDAGSRFRIVRATKNRFGAVNELAFFAMTEGGLREVANPSAIFLARPESIAPGSIVTVAREGGRPLLVEIQGLVDPMRFGNPRRVAQGLDANRLSMLLAVLNRHGGLSLQDHDVFANVVGGLEVRETATDLPLLLALASSLRDRALPQTLVAFGEVGLTGEVRPVAYGEERLREAAKQGFRTCPGAARQRAAPCDRGARGARRVAARRGGRGLLSAELTPTERTRTVRIALSATCSTSNCRAPMRSAVPATGIVSSCSTSRPFRVFGPSVGRCQPSARFSARMVALALTM